MEKNDLTEWLKLMIEKVCGPSRRHSVGPPPDKQRKVLECFLNSPGLSEDTRIPVDALIKAINKPGAQSSKTEQSAALREMMRGINKNIRASGYSDAVLVYDKAWVQFLASTKLAEVISAAMEDGLSVAKKKLRKLTQEGKPNYRRRPEAGTKSSPEESTNLRITKKLFTAHLRSRKYQHRLSRVQMFPGMDGSPFNILALLPFARKRILLMGPNLWWPTNNAKDAVFTWLKEGAGREFHMVFTNPLFECARKFLRAVSNNFEDHLSDSCSKLVRWQKEARAQGLAFDARVTNTATAVMTTIDPDSPHGVLVITPVLADQPITGERIHFCLTKWDNGDEFSKYWTCLDTIWIGARPLGKEHFASNSFCMARAKPTTELAKDKKPSRAVRTR